MMRPTSTAVVTDNTQATPSSTMQAIADSVSVTVEGSAMKFNPTTIRVKKGQTVNLTFKNLGGNHDWVIDEFNARTKVIAAEQSEMISFVADVAGEFEYYCSVPGHRQAGMKGTLIVE